MLPCPACGTRTDVKDTRTSASGRVRKRRRECPGCGNRFSTAEKRARPSTAREAIRSDRNHEIRRLARRGVPHTEIADAFGLTRRWVGQIVKGRAS